MPNSIFDFPFCASLLLLVSVCSSWMKKSRAAALCAGIRECRVKSFFNQLFNPINIIERELLSRLYFSANFCARTARLSKQTRARVHSHAVVEKFHSHNFFHEKGKNSRGILFFIFSISLAAKNQEQQAITSSNESIFSPLVVFFRGASKLMSQSIPIARARWARHRSMREVSTRALLLDSRQKGTFQLHSRLVVFIQMMNQEKMKRFEVYLRKIEFLKKKTN